MPSSFPFDMQAIARRAMADYGFAARFPDEVTEEVRALREPGELQRIPDGCKDLRNLLWSSIDNADSRDLDQLEFCERDARGDIRVLAAIADVDALVVKSCGIDRHAFHNGTSVYTGVAVFPMLPERLSTDMSSLNPDEDRLAIVMEFFVRRDGSVRFGDVFRAAVRNQAKLVYESIGDWLEEKGPVPEIVQRTPGLKEQIVLQDEAACRMENFRKDQGALELETIEARAVMEDGTVKDLAVKTKNRARCLIENFMIGANMTMMRFLSRKGSPFIQRILPPPERWPRIRTVAESWGTALPAEPDAVALANFLIQQKQKFPEKFADLSLMMVKLLGPGEYALGEPGKENTGHFGLAVQDYTHSTAPNRRYVDLIVQRLVKAVLVEGNTPYSKLELQHAAQWCTERDKAAKKVERFMRKVAGAVLLRKRIGETFDAIVTGASVKGTYVRLLHPPVEGRVMRGERGLDVGERVRVRLLSLEPEKGYIDFEGA